jgi:hypothetical protein
METSSLNVMAGMAICPRALSGAGDEHADANAMTTPKIPRRIVSLSLLTPHICHHLP